MPRPGLQASVDQRNSSRDHVMPKKKMAVQVASSRRGLNAISTKPIQGIVDLRPSAIRRGTMVRRSVQLSLIAQSSSLRKAVSLGSRDALETTILH
ncbi:hypothetical protein X753_20170 [Mesorhizobium sp. LNJC399B00]|nr:hypothetical protein X753_20170 [Mesorhizobium sp. LNJC399B00]